LLGWTMYVNKPYRAGNVTFWYTSPLTDIAINFAASPTPLFECPYP